MNTKVVKIEKRIEKLFEALSMGILVSCIHGEFRLFRQGDMLCEERCRDNEGLNTYALTSGFYAKLQQPFACGCPRYRISSEEISWLYVLLNAMTEDEYIAMCGNIGLNKIKSGKLRV